MRTLGFITVLAFGAGSACLGRTPSPPTRLVADALRFDALILAAAQPGRSQWLITGTHGKTNVVHVCLVATGRHHTLLWSRVFEGGYDPVTYPAYRWTYHNQPILLFTVQHGAAWQTLTVIGLGPHGPVVLQQIDGGAFDVISVTSQDGNGDVRSIDGSMPLTHHCFDWVAEPSRFVERPCKTLQGQPAAAP